ncbi:S8 family serine peptidase [Streptomyces sp. NPDC058220]|uniref:S8 family serine peptidase n=1 Tax=unclassified Streptomyces TaxID=2593676 RepID=UPI0036EF9BFB
MRWTRLSAAVSTALLLTAGAVAPVSAQPPAPNTPVADSAPAGPGTTVRLITGDRVTVSAGPDGKRVASVEPGPGREGIVFRTAEEDGGLSVLPSDAIGPVSSGRLDRRLFDVTELLAQGYDEAHTDALPLIVSQPAGEPAAALDRWSALNEDVAPSRRLDSINARSLRIEAGDLGRFWKQLVPGSGDASTARAAAVPTVWLDGRVSPTLDRSTAQINAPAAWAAGYQGQGVKVAVLDTGADLTHPDLAGRATTTKDFSGSAGTNDVFGHGTHVAATVGGSGAASGGTRKGVAPRAELVIGKVLGDDGYGTESAVIDGMEWAAAEGARVVNMSLGSDAPSDGTDPMSLAVNGLSRSSGALFVVAAGNSGEMGEQTIGSPGAADAALTVGAVDRDDSLAAFSSRGPRPGDRAVKPDVTAPGVGIVAARATGTTMGDPVDPYYVTASGTSMATPHVAGAAALLAQQHPDWDAVRLKDALVSTARTVPGQQVTEQGGGRIDLAAALGPVTATGTVSLGSFVSGGAAGRAQDTTVRYTNTSPSEVTLRLAVRLATSGGQEIADGGVRLGSDSVRIAAGGTAEVPLHADPSVVERGDYYGYVSATTADGTVAVHTTVSLAVHGPVHRLTVNTVDHHGKRVQALPTIWGADGFVNYISADPAVAEVEEGTYQLSHSSLDDAPDGQELREVVLPEVKVTKDMSVTLDARKTTQVEIRTPKPAEQRGALSYQTYRQLGGHGLIQGTMFFDIAKRLYVSPTAKVTEGRFEFASRWQLVAPLLEAEVPGTKIALRPYYTHTSALFGAKGARLTAVDAGSSSAPDFRGSRVRGKLAVVRDDGSDERDLAKAAAKAGAAGLMLVFPSDMYSWTRWTPVGDRLALPTLRVSAAEGGALLDRAGRHATTVEFSGTAESPYLYDVMQVSAGQVPQRVVHTVSDRNSAVVKATYADGGGTSWASEQRFGLRPYQDFFWNQYSRFVPTGTQRTEYVSADDTLWQHVVNDAAATDVDTPLTVGMRDDARTYRPGKQPEENWFEAVVRPSIPRGTTTPSVRSGDVLSLRIPEFTDSGTGHWSRALTGGAGGGIGTSARSAVPEGDTVSARLYRDGKKTADAADAWADFRVAPGEADYRLDLSTSRGSAESGFGIRTETSWSFRSDTTAGTATLPLLQLDYDVPVDERNTVTARRDHEIALTVRAQDGLPAPRGVTVRVETSYDDGRSWTKEARARDRGQNRFTATVERPARTRGDTYVTLRVTATDSAGNTIRQTVERAYLLSE